MDRVREVLPARSLLDLGDYERARDGMRARAIAARRLRRVELGAELSVHFENLSTIRYQIQEMLRAERIVQDRAIAHEIETYGRLLPGPAELSATLMVELEDPRTRPARLAELVGIQDALGLEIEGAGRALGVFDPDQYEEGRISAVQFVRFALSPAQLAALEAGRRAELVVAHPALGARATLDPELQRALLEDMREIEQRAEAASPRRGGGPAR